MENNVFILTGDTPATSTTLKRLLLLYNKVFMSDLSDCAILNHREVIERFESAKVEWGAMGHFPRVNNYEDLYKENLSDADSFLARRLIVPIKSNDVKTIDPGSHWVAYNAALSNEKLVKAGAMDASVLKPEIAIPNGIINGATIQPTGTKSIYNVECKPYFKLDGVSDDWNSISYLRVGRAIKAMRIAQAVGASPIAIDEVNENISYAFINNNDSLYSKHESIYDFAINTSVIDNDKLEKIMVDASWDDVLHMRKETLPVISETRSLMQEKLKSLRIHSFSEPGDLLKALDSLKSDFDQLREAEIQAWESLRLGSILGLSGSVGAATLGSSIIALPSCDSFSKAIVAMVSCGLVCTAAMKGEIAALLPARRKVREHPMFLIDRCRSLPML